MSVIVAASPFYRQLRAALVLVLALLLLAACASSRVTRPPATAQDAIPPAAEMPEVPAYTPIDAQTKVALLLPLSGEQAALGESLLQAAQLALFEAPEAGVALIVRDTGGNPVRAAQAAQEAIREGAGLVLGPVFGNSVSAVAPVARAAGVNVVSFSTDRSVAQPGVFVMGILPGLQVQRLVGYAGRQGLQRIAALLPQSPYGQTVRDALQTAARGARAQVVRIDFYDPRALDAAPAVGQLGQFIAGGGAVDAVLVPEGEQRLEGIVNLFPSYGIDPLQVRLLGSTLWLGPTPWNPSRVAANPALSGSWFVSTPMDRWREFQQRYRAAYGSDPNVLASIAYDATLLAILLAGDPNGPDFSLAALTDPAGFSGVDGIFRFRTDGTVERGLAVIEVRDGFVDVREPAPATFDDVIY
jgi:ABC-type branched-subunit amino acid transport system substrate-binding protein